MNYEYELKFVTAILNNFKVASSVLLLSTDEYCNKSAQHYIPEE